jgi:secreted PhoX family phosphatase
VTIYGNWDRRVTRREALAIGGATAAAAALGSTRTARAQGVPEPGFGPLTERPDAIALPRGFQYRIISVMDKPMSDGKPNPGDPDGQVAVPGPGNLTILIRNHELGFMDLHVTGVEGDDPFSGGDAEERGGTTAVWVDPERRNVRDYVTSAGTRNNCAGGGTPWGTWLTCEEDRNSGHGFVFEVLWDDPEGPLTRQPITAMGRFSHEAIDIDPSTGIAYLTEDDFRGGDTVAGSDSRISYLYRYLPDDRTPAPGNLQKGGQLQALAIEELGSDAASRTADFFTEGQTFGVVWKNVGAADPPADAEAQGCVRFNRLEGAHFEGGAFWFDDTVGGGTRVEDGNNRRGQMFRLIPGASETAPGADTLELFLESSSANEMESPDNVYVTPWGDVWFAEDGVGENRVMGITPAGETYEFARTIGSEFAGPAFSPDGRTFFLNAQDHQVTYAIWGPFPRQNRAARRQMAAAAPPAGLGPQVSGELAEAAQRHGLSVLEAAAYDRLGVRLV